MKGDFETYARRRNQVDSKPYTPYICDETSPPTTTDLTQRKINNKQLSSIPKGFQNRHIAKGQGPKRNTQSKQYALYQVKPGAKASYMHDRIFSPLSTF